MSFASSIPAFKEKASNIWSLSKAIVDSDT